jgi:hypothetical protein
LIRALLELLVREVGQGRTREWMGRSHMQLGDPQTERASEGQIPEMLRKIREWLYGSVPAISLVMGGAVLFGALFSTLFDPSLTAVGVAFGGMFGYFTNFVARYGTRHKG